MKRLFLLLLALIPAYLFGQVTLSGIVVDSITNEPMPSATVYINGTTHGTVTDYKGHFELKDVTLPSTLVASFVGYEPKALELTGNPGDLTVKMSARNELPEIDVSGNSINKKDLDYFREMFLGNDTWGKNAVLKNPNAVIVDNSFQKINYIRKISRNTYATEHITNNLIEMHAVMDDTVTFKRSVMTAWATEPLVVDLPLLGYILYVDLVRFYIVQVNNVVSCNILGYFYYKPYKLNKRNTQRIEQNRMKAYWGSSQHFLKSFSDNRLQENGFMLSIPEIIKKRGKKIVLYKPVDIEKYSSGIGDSVIQVNGLSDVELRIRYYHKSNGTPRNFKQKRWGISHYYESGVSFLKDTCTFRREGILTDNTIRFSGDISKKRVGSCLPDDYMPLEDITLTADAEENNEDTVDPEQELRKIANNINEFNSLFPQEKVYLEFDNTAYFQGETIWYKAFVRNATSLAMAPSQVLYVDFLSPTGKLLMQQKIKVEGGQADGNIPLLNTGTLQSRERQGIVAYPSGFYEIRAYTQNMLDFSHDAIFSRVIPVYTQPKFVGEYDRSHVDTYNDNPLMEHVREEIKPIDSDVNVTFYPEGGDLIKGLPGRVAFKATGRDAFGIEGTLLVPETGDSAYTVHDGMGSFIITPNRKDKVQFITADGKTHTFSLPNFKDSGYSMMADMISDSLLQLNIWRTPDHAGEPTALAVTCRGELIHFQSINDIEDSSLDIDCSDWPLGVCRLTLFNNQGMIMSSRSIYHNNDELAGPILTVNLDSISNDAFCKDVIEIRLTNNDGAPLHDRFCLSVRDADDYGNGRTDNLQTNLLLSSDLKGYIHDPAWYLESNDDEHREALDLLTLVQGWERYEWQYMTGQKEFEERHRVEENLSLNGWILSHFKKEPLSGMQIYAALMPHYDKTQFETFNYQTDSSGYFGFDISDFYGKADLSIHMMSTNNKGKSRYHTGKRIRFERAERPQPRPYISQDTALSHNMHKVERYKVDFSDIGLTPEQRKKLGRMIDEVDIEQENEKIRFVDYDTFTSFEAEEDTELELDFGEYSSDLFDYFQKRGIVLETSGSFEQPLFGDYSPIDNRLSGNGSSNDYSSNQSDNSSNDYSSNQSDNSSKKSSSDGAVRISPFYYIHTLNEWHDYENVNELDMVDIKSIIIYDKPMYPREFKDMVQLMVEKIWEKNDFGWINWFDNSDNRYQLVDILLKEDSKRLFEWEKRNLSRRTTTVKGFNKPVQFYSPQYPDGPISGEIDSRRTLYWNPNVTTDYEGNARIEFYNNSFTKKFTISGAGITTYGEPFIINQDW